MQPNVQIVTLLPSEALLAAVPDHDDLIKFRYDFTIEGKALEDGTPAPTVVETESGDLIIEGYAAVFEGIDRQGENFAPGAFQRGIKSFLESQAALCFHHKHDQVLGKVLDLREEGKGLKMRARVDGAIKTHPELGTYYQQIKSGTLNGLSVAGFFKRGHTGAGPRIIDMDFSEISITGVPVHTGPSFAVVAGKALASDLKSDHLKIPKLPETDIRDSDFNEIQFALEAMDRIFTQLTKRAPDTTPAAAN